VTLFGNAASTVQPARYIAPSFVQSGALLRQTLHSPM